jgi:hypothetical protein
MTLFGRKTRDARGNNDIFSCVFLFFWGVFALQTIDGQKLAGAGPLQKKSCLKTYGRFLVLRGFWQTQRMRVEMTLGPMGIVARVFKICRAADFQMSLRQAAAWAFAPAGWRIRVQLRLIAPHDLTTLTPNNAK